MNDWVYRRDLSAPVPPERRPQVLTWSGRLDDAPTFAVDTADALTTPQTNEAVVLSCFTRWAVDGLARLIGDWSVAIDDTVHQAIVLASDYAGVRPLYYHRSGEQVTWSFDLERLVDAVGAHELDEQYIAAFLTLGASPDRTPYVGVQIVPPGHAVILTATATTVRAFWSLPTGDITRYRDERRYDEQLRAWFREAVAGRLNTDYPVMIELSGGLDSSSVLCMATQLIRSGAVRAPRLITVSYTHHGSTDLPFIAELERFCDVEGVHLSTDDQPLIAESAAGGAMPAAWQPLHAKVAEIAREAGARTLLTGQMGDLVFGNWHDDSLQVAAPLRRGRVGEACGDALAWSKVLQIPVAWILGRALRAVWPFSTIDERLYVMPALTTAAATETSLTRDFFVSAAAQASSRTLDSWRDAPPERRKHFHAAAMMRQVGMLRTPAPLQGLDYSHPLAHRPLLECLLTIPPDVLNRPGEPRRLMRRALGELWPETLRRRRSKGLFNRPWLQALRPLARQLLSSTRWHVAEYGWIDRAGAARRLEKLIHGLECNLAQLRQIIILELWLRRRELRLAGSRASQTLTDRSETRRAS